MKTALLTTTYFGPVQWYQKLVRYDRCIIEQHDTFQKQTYRNRCVIATANGLQALTVPVEHQLPAADDGTRRAACVKDVRISDHAQWRRVHWNALSSAYSESPFFDYYADDLHDFFSRRYDYLIDLNEAIRQTVCSLIDLHPAVSLSSEFTAVAPGSRSADVTQQEKKISHRDNSVTCREKKLSYGDNFVTCRDTVADFRQTISAKHPGDDPEFEARPYWQVFGRRYGFQPNLSILDLLFCMGPEAIFYL